MRKFIVAAAALSMVAGSVPAFAAQTGSGIGSVVNCDASGHRQATGAALGALAGMVVGNNVSKSKSAPVLGAVAGAAAGSYVGCAQQRKMAAEKGLGTYAATTAVNVRSQPTTASARKFTLVRGERVLVQGWNGNWALVKTGREQMGYVSASYLTPVQLANY